MLHFLFTCKLKSTPCHRLTKTTLVLGLPLWKNKTIFILPLPIFFALVWSFGPPQERIAKMREKLNYSIKIGSTQNYSFKKLKTFYHSFSTYDLIKMYRTNAPFLRPDATHKWIFVLFDITLLKRFCIIYSFPSLVGTIGKKK
jgi:hypothetical protein